MVQVASLRISIFSNAEARDKFLYNMYMAMINIINSNRGTEFHEKNLMFLTRATL